MDFVPLRNALTVDVEEHFHASAMAPYVPRPQWDQQPSRVAASTERLLRLFDEQRVRATFFVLGWVAKRQPQLVQRIVAEGHELASHGFSHERIGSQGYREFWDDITRARKLLEDLGGVRVHGYRAPSFSVSRNTPWAFPALEAAGYTYSSSVYPVRHDHYGIPDAPREPYRPAGTRHLLEIPPATLRLFGCNLPAAGGGYFRLLPYGVTRRAWRRLNGREGRAGVFYVHPWELDAEQPRPRGLRPATRFRHYVNLSRTEGRLRRLLAEFNWGRMDRIFLTPDPDAAAQHVEAFPERGWAL